jgi:predicted nucleic acid-binding Zn ribbon protein
MIFEIENDPALQVNVEDSSGVINFKAASIIKKLNALKEETKEILDKQLRRKKKILEWFDAFAEIVELRTFELQNQLFL